MKPIITLGTALLLAVHSIATEARVAILGDSITYSGRWPTLVESALRNTPPFADAEIVNFGLSSETLSGLSEPGHAGGKFPRPDLHERLDRILADFKPTLVLACYGMNDGIYLPLDRSRTKAFQDGAMRLKDAVTKIGGTIVFITPPLYQADKPAQDRQGYDAVLDAYADWLVSRRKNGWNVIDIRPDLKKAIHAAKQADPSFIYASDGIHPGPQGHDFIAASVSNQLWPLLHRTDTPNPASGLPLEILLKRNELLKHAWLSKTGHKRPGVPQGLPLEAANSQASEMLKAYRTALQTPLPTTKP